MPAIISGAFVLNLLELYLPMQNPKMPIIKLANVIALTGNAIFIFINANETPTAKASILVAIESRKMFIIVSFCGSFAFSVDFAEISILTPRTQSIVQAIACPTE